MEDIFGKIPFDDGMVAIKVYVWMGEEEEEWETKNEEYRWWWTAREMKKIKQKKINKWSTNTPQGR